MPNAIDLLLDRETVERPQRQAQEQPDAPVEGDEGLRENARCTSSGVPMTGAGPRYPNAPSWAGQAPLANFLGGVVAHGKHKIHRRSAGLRELVPVLLRASAVGRFAASSSSNASGRTLPEGWLPALQAVKRGLPQRFIMASAVIVRAEFAVHRKRTL